MKVKKIQYENGFVHFPDLSPAKKVVPLWYKNIKIKTKDKPAFRNTTLKGCVPFLDALTTGYVLTLAGDLIVDKDENDNQTLAWGETELANIRSSNGAELLPIPTGYSNIHFFWHVITSIKLPKGYSALFTHPLNRHDLPFLTLSGVVDDYPMAPGSLPFFMQENFTGVIPAGTPFVQIIPFKRENWISKKTEKLFEQGLISKLQSNSMVIGWYKNNIWTRKNYD
jgi:hypothetical protein